MQRLRKVGYSVFYPEFVFFSCLICFIGIMKDLVEKEKQNIAKKFRWKSWHI